MMFFMVMVAGSLSGKAAEEKVVTRINGSVDGRKVIETAWTPIFTARPLTDGDWARTGLESLAKIYLAGGRHFVKLFENTQVEMSKVELPTEGGLFKLKQALGQIRVSFDKFLGKSHRMEVQTPTATLSVRGTTFDSLVLSNGTTILDVVRGVVRVITNAGLTLLVSAGHGAIISSDGSVHLTDVKFGRAIQTSLTRAELQDPADVSALAGMRVLTSGTVGPTSGTPEELETILGTPALLETILGTPALPPPSLPITGEALGGTAVQQIVNPITPPPPTTGTAAVIIN